MAMSGFGSTGVDVPRLGLGGHTFLSEYGGMGHAERAELLEIVTTAVGAGMNLFDVTFDEERVLFGSCLSELGLRDRIFLSCWMAQKKTESPAALKEEARRAVSLLRVDHLDLLYLHRTCTAEQIEAMVELRDSGLTKCIGVFGLSQALESDLSAMDIVLVNYNYHLREDEPDIQRLTEQKVDIIGLEPLGRGRFARDIAPEGVSMVAACLKHVLACSAIDTVLVAVRRLAHLNENIAIWKGDWDLTAAERTALEEGKGYETL